MSRSVADKMGISAVQKVFVADGPAAAVAAIDLPTPPILADSAEVPDHIIYFVKTKDSLESNFQHYKNKLAKGGKLWVAWPKGGKPGTDLNIKEVIRIGYNHGLVESVNLRIDDTWTALKFTRPKPGKTYNNSYGSLPDKSPKM